VSLESSGFGLWWADTDDVSRKAILSLQAGDYLPGDLALDMQFYGVRIVADGVTWSEEDHEWVGLYEQPAEVLELLTGVSDDHPK
jgi:hypothetical protein